MNDPGYTSPSAFRRAITDRLKKAAAPTGLWTLPELQRQFAYDRLIVRLYKFDPTGWVLKGSTALLARGITVRHTVDIDIYRAGSREQAEQDLREALLLDAGDFFEFTAGPSQNIADGASGCRIKIEARIGATVWAAFHVDVVSEGVRMTGVPEEVPPLTFLHLDLNLQQPGYHAYPLVDHVADKVCGIVEPRPRGYPSTRFKDLIDLVAIVSSTGVGACLAEQQRAALESEADRRGFTLPGSFQVPDATLWTAGYAQSAAKSRLQDALSLDEALGVVRPFLDPLLDGTAAGEWDPVAGRWTA